MNIKTTTIMHHRVLGDLLKLMEKTKQTKLVSTQPNMWKMILWSKAGYLAAAFLIISSWAVSFFLYREVSDLRDELKIAWRYVTATPSDETTTINLYLKEHQDVVAQKASLNAVTPQPLQMQVSQHDIIYYEIFDNQPEYMRPGIIIRGPSSQQQINSSETTAISNGHKLTLSEAKEAVNFDLVSPSWLQSGYILDQVRKIEGHETVQFLYTDGINSVSLFEQSLDSHRILEPQDFREYAVYRNRGQIGGTILAWTDNVLSYVLIGNIEISQLMDMAQSINAENKEK